MPTTVPKQEEEEATMGVTNEQLETAVMNDTAEDVDHFSIAHGGSVCC